MSLKVTIDRLGQIQQGLKLLAETRVMVGIPAEKAQRRDGKITNAALGYIHENGAPEVNVPARPFLVPGVQRAQEQTEDYLKQAGGLALDGKPASAERAMVAAGLNAVNKVRETISEGIPPPLAPSTIARRRVRSPGSSYRRKATTASEVTPLIDTAQMRNAITTVLRKEK